MREVDRFSTELNPLWLRAHAGDEAAYAQALCIIAARLRGYFARRLSSLPDETEDLVQETLMALHTKRGTYDPALPASHWVLAIAGYKLVDFWRRHGRREALHQPLDMIHENIVNDNIIEEFPAKRDVKVLLDSLPSRQRTAIEMTRIEGLSMSEASRRSGVSVSALKVQVHRGLKRLAARVRTSA
jgi:RNA polymerase sigma-70 factor, ECF subfamily